ncbi:MAG: hypothetical protein AAF846_23325 [Chloroflexota bacterium]
MKPKRKQKFDRKLAFLFSLPFLYFAVMLLLCVSPYVIGGILRAVVLPPEPLQPYEADAVLEICTTLNISPDDVFCAEPQSQNGDTFRQLLETYYPRGTVYAEFIPRIDEWSPTTGECNQTIIYDSCALPNICNRGRTYLCAYDIDFTNASIQLNVRINRHTGTILRYQILEYSDS